MEHHACPVSLAGRSQQEVTEVHIGGERRLSPPSPVANGVHEARVREGTGCRPRIFREDEARTGVIGMPPPGRGESSSTHASGRPKPSKKRRDLAYAGDQIPARLQHSLLHGRDGGSAGESFRGRGCKRSRWRPDENFPGMFSMSLAPADPCWAPEPTANDSRT